MQAVEATDARFRCKFIPAEDETEHGPPAGGLASVIQNGGARSHIVQCPLYLNVRNEAVLMHRSLGLDVSDMHRDSMQYLSVLDSRYIFILRMVPMCLPSIRLILLHEELNDTERRVRFLSLDSAKEGPLGGEDNTKKIQFANVLRMYEYSHCQQTCYFITS